MSATAQAARSDRRRTERKPYAIEAFICSPTATKKSERVEARSVNINRHGIAFSVNKPIAVSSFYIVEVGIGEQHLISEIRIISCRKGTDGNYEVGAEFC